MPAEQYAIENGVQNICICGNLKTFKGYAKGYSRTCGSKKCINTAYKSTLLDNYGVLNVFQLETVKSKSKQTNLEKYGHEHPTQSKQIKEKVKQTNLNRHGVEYIFKNKTFIDKREETNLKKYGFKHATQSNQIKNKTKESNLEKYSKHPSKIKENRHKSNTTRMLNEDIKNPSRELVRKKLKEYDNKSLNILSLAKEYNVEPNWLGRQLKKQNINIKHCNFSNTHKEISDYISELGYNVKNNDRIIIKPLEIDIVVDNLAIEVNGIYWHTSNNTDSKLKHKNKMDLILSKKFDFLSITDIEWHSKQDIIKSIISNRLKSKNTKTLYARKLKFLQVSNSEAKTFLKENHLKGDNCNFSVSFGLYDQDELVACICFGKPRFSKKYQNEIIRLCFKKYTRIVGGFAKLLKNSNINNIVSYVDNDKFNGESYKNLGFKLISENGPSYFYWKNGEILSRYQCQKHKLCKILQNYNEALTEHMNMFNNGYRIYWNCGSKTYEKI